MLLRAHALLRAASALVPTPGLPVGEGYGETSGGSSNNISPLKCLWHQYTPPVRENPVTKPYQQVTMEPLLKLGTAASWRKHDESLADFTNRDSAEKQRRYRL
jgi:hypothetical protein